LGFRNDDVMQNICGVLEEISGALQGAPRPPHPNPLPSGEKERACANGES
jgi:hypothetical protein